MTPSEPGASGRQRHQGGVGAEGASSGSVRIVGWLLGMSAGLVAVRLPGLPAGVPLFGVFAIGALAAASLLTPAAVIRSKRLVSVDVVLLGYVCLRTSLELYNAIDLGHPISFAYLADMSFAVSAFIAARFVVQNWEDCLTLFRPIVAVGVVVSVIGTVQLLQLGPVNQLLVAYTRSGGLADRLDAGWDIRATSTIGTWTALGGYLALILALQCVLMLSGRAKSLIRSSLITLTLVVGQIATLTFATVFVSLLVLAVTARRLRLDVAMIASASVAGLIGYILFGSLIIDRLSKQAGVSPSTGQMPGWIPESVAYRMNIWIKETVPTILERPWVGWGNEAYASDMWPRRPILLSWLSPESEWLRTAIAAGFLGLAVELALFVLIVSLFARAARYGTQPLVAVMIGLLAASLTHSHFANRAALLLTFLLVGAVGALTGVMKQRQTVPASGKDKALDQAV